jgi:hypothetical protein
MFPMPIMIPILSGGSFSLGDAPLLASIVMIVSMFILVFYLTAFIGGVCEGGIEKPIITYNRGQKIFFTYIIGRKLGVWLWGKKSEKVETSYYQEYLTLQIKTDKIKRILRYPTITHKEAIDEIRKILEEEK